MISQVRVIPRESRGVRRPNNSVGHPKRIPILSESGFGSPASEVSLEESDVPIIVWDTRKGSNSERIGSRNRTVYLETNWEIAQF